MDMHTNTYEHIPSFSSTHMYTTERMRKKKITLLLLYLFTIKDDFKLSIGIK